MSRAGRLGPLVVQSSKKLWRWLIVAGLGGLGCLAFPLGCTVVGIRGGYEEASHTRLEKQGAVEIREYDQLVVVYTEVSQPFEEAGNQAFRRLFRYISGNNAGEKKIAMTTPVIAGEQNGAKIAMTTPLIGNQRVGENWRYMFVLPSTFTIDNAPEPSDDSVQLAVIPPRKVAVIRFAGRWKEPMMRAKTEELLAWVEQSDYKAVSSPIAAGYDPPWTLPPLRRNEVMVDIEPE